MAINDEIQENKMQYDTPRYAHCMEVLSQSPLFSNLVLDLQALLEKAEHQIRYRTQ